MEEMIAYSYVGVLNKLKWEVQEPGAAAASQAYTNYTCMIKCPPNYYRSVDALEECLPCPGSRYKSWYGSRNHIKRAHDGDPTPNEIAAMFPETRPEAGRRERFCCAGAGDRRARECSLHSAP